MHTKQLLNKLTNYCIICCLTFLHFIKNETFLTIGKYDECFFKFVQNYFHCKYKIFC